MRRVSRVPSASSASWDCELKHQLSTLLYSAWERRETHQDPSPRRRRNCVKFVTSQVLSQTPCPLSNQALRPLTQSSPEESGVPYSTCNTQTTRNRLLKVVEEQYTKFPRANSASTPRTGNSSKGLRRLKLRLSLPLRLLRGL